MATIIEAGITPEQTILQEHLYELIDGEFVEKTVGAKQTWAASLLLGWLFVYLKERPIGRATVEMLFQLGEDPNRLRRPDVAFVSAQRYPLDRPLEGTAWRVVPNLVVEIVSPTDRFSDVQIKVKEYLAAGVEALWLVEERTKCVWVYSDGSDVKMLGSDDVIDGGTMLPGFSMPVAELFRN
jgi:Uma2 family endonuclease